MMLEAPLVLDSQLVSLTDFLEHPIKRDRHILHQHEYIIGSSDRQLLSNKIIDLLYDNFDEVLRRWWKSRPQPESFMKNNLP